MPFLYPRQQDVESRPVQEGVHQPVVKVRLVRHLPRQAVLVPDRHPLPEHPQGPVVYPNTPGHRY